MPGSTEPHLYSPWFHSPWSSVVPHWLSFDPELPFDPSYPDSHWIHPPQTALVHIDSPRTHPPQNPIGSILPRLPLYTLTPLGPILPRIRLDPSSLRLPLSHIDFPWTHSPSDSPSPTLTSHGPILPQTLLVHIDFPWTPFIHFVAIMCPVYTL